MDKNSIIEYKESFISRLKKFFINLFRREKKENNTKKEISNFNTQNDRDIETETAEDFFEELKIDSTDIDKVINRKKFLEEIDGNAKYLNMLSIERLKRLEKYYNEIIEKNNNIIKKLKADI